MLGSHGTWPLPGGATSGYLVRHEGFNMWVDMGSGTMAKIQEHLGLLDLDAVVVSHTHPDHLVDLYPLFYARSFHPDRPEGLPLFVPPGAYERAGALISESGAADMKRVFDIRTVELGGSFEIGPFRVLTAEMRHPVPTLGMRIEADGSVLAYSADTGPTEALVELARGADVLLAEATWPRDVEGLPPLHLSAAQAADHAARAEAGRLVLTHIWPTNDRSAAAEQASARFAGEVTVAEEGMKVEP